MPLIGNVDSWDKAFDKADELLAKGELSHVAVAADWEHDKGKFVSVPLISLGTPQTTLTNLRKLSPILHGNKSNLKLYHSKLQAVGPNEIVNGWLLAIIFPTK